MLSEEAGIIRLNCMRFMSADKKHQHAHSPTIEQVLAELKKAQLKLTSPRKAILQVLVNEHGPFTAEEVFKKISRRVCDQATVYRTLASLEEVGILRRCEFGDGSARWEISDASGGHHHHLICKKCKRVEIVDDCEIEGIDRVAQRRGFSNISHVLEFFGLCPDCKNS
jgi:Fur family ferric uptake transcriptional regulator